MATQCSTNSILGAPAFVAFVAGGGLIWLQYELAVPLAMIVLITLVFPTLYRAGGFSIYEFLEHGSTGQRGSGSAVSSRLHECSPQR